MTGQNPPGRAAAIIALTLIAVLLGASRPGRAADIPSPASGTLYLKSSPDAEPVEALRMATIMHAEVTGNVARVHVVQKFSNTGSDWVEGLYVFPLSPDAAVDELLMTVGERTVRGEIQEKVKAQSAYAEARSQGKRASIVDQSRPNMFTTAVANIAPGSTVSIDIAYLETIPFKDSHYTLRLPLAITPRYTPGVAIDTGAPLPAAHAGFADALQNTTATPERVTALRQTADISVELSPGFPLGEVSSLHHPATIQDDGHGKSIQLRGSQIAADRDFELTWAPAAGTDVAAAAFAEKFGDDTYALVMLSPPAAAATGPTVPREITFIIDTSGSMQGPSIEQASAALQLGIARLQSMDRFNVIRFASDYSTLFSAPQPVTSGNRALAGRFIASLRADGGTEMRAPLEYAMSSAGDGGYMRQIVFITDGSVGNEAELLALIHQRIGSARLFTVGIGAAPNSWFLQQAAGEGRGSYTFIAERAQVELRMQDLFQKLERPALVDLKLRWPEDVAGDLGAPLPGDVFAGDPLVILARLPRAPSGYLVLSGRVRGTDWTHQVEITRVGAQAGLAKLWARQRIDALSRRIRYGGDRDQLRGAVTDLALRHHLVSEFTSLVAVDATVTRPPGSSGHVEQAPISAPAGSYWATAGFAQTATPSELLLLCGLASLAVASLLFWARPVCGRVR